MSPYKSLTKPTTLGYLELKCPICLNVFWLRQYYVDGHPRYCSKKCSYISKIGKLSGENNPLWKGGVIIHDGYRYFNKGKNFPGVNKQGYIRANRFLMQEKLGRVLRRDEDVHHLNGNKLDDRIENLIILTKTEHGLFHRREQIRLGIKAGRGQNVTKK